MLYQANKAGQVLFACDAAKDCNWQDDRKNLQVGYEIGQKRSAQGEDRRKRV